MKPIYDESLYCQECDTEITTQEDLFNGHLCDECAIEMDVAYLKLTNQWPIDEPETPIYNRAYVDRLFRDGMNDY